MRRFSGVILLIGAAFFFSCSHPSDPAVGGGNPNGNGNGNNVKDTASYGTSTMLLEGNKMVKCTDNYFLYDSSNRTLSFQFVNDTGFYLLLQLQVPQLAAGTYTYPPNSGGMWVTGSKSSIETIIPYNGNTVQLIIKSVSFNPGRITAIISVHVGDTEIGLHSIDSVKMTDARLTVIPSGNAPSFTCTAGTKTFSGTNRQVFRAAYFPPVPIQLSYSTQSFTNGDTSIQFSLTLNPAKNVVGKYTLQSGANMHYYMQWFNNLLDKQFDSSYRSQYLDSTDIEVTSYDTLTRKISGTFTGQVTEDNARTKLNISGEFKDVTLEDF